VPAIGLLERKSSEKTKSQKNRPFCMILVDNYLHFVNHYATHLEIMSITVPYRLPFRDGGLSRMFDFHHHCSDFSLTSTKRSRIVAEIVFLSLIIFSCNDAAMLNVPG